MEALIGLVMAVGVIVMGIGVYVLFLTAKTAVSTNAMVAQIDAAVNGKQPGETTMVSQVQDMYDRDPDDAVLPLLKKLVTAMEKLTKEET